MNDWYQNLNKPSWAPQESVFGTVWSILYPVIFFVNAYVIFLLSRGRIGLYVAIPFWLNLLFNLLFTPIQFGLKNNLLALADITLVLVTIIWSMIAIWPHAKTVTFAFVPYLLWVCIATALQVSITLKN